MRIGLRTRLRVVEAAVALGVMRVVVSTIPFAWWSGLAGRPERSPTTEPDATTDAVARAVGRAVAAAARRLPWSSTCLVQALAARVMLSVRRRSSTLVLGVASENGVFRAHAWLLSGGGTVCGGQEAPGYTAIAALYSAPPAGRRAS
jgi:hypothetical protein